MTHRRPTMPALAAPLALALLAAAPAAQAFITADARITRLGYTLVDLNPGDGIAPGITFAPRPDGYGGGSAIETSFGYLDRRIDPDAYGLQGGERAVDGFRPFAPLSTRVDVPGLGTGGFMAGSVARHSFRYVASGHFDPGGADGANWLGTELRTSTEAATFGLHRGASAFELTPFTKVVWTGTGAIRLRSTSDLGADAEHFTQGFVSFELRDAEGQLLEGFSHYEALQQRGRGQRHFADDFSLSFSNDGAGRSTVYMLAINVASMNIQPSTAGVAAPVPEPGSWALMLCGLGVVGAAAARSRRATTGGGDGGGRSGTGWRTAVAAA